MVQPLAGGPRRQVRCGLPFQELLDKEAPQSIIGRDPVDALYRLFSACVPYARRVFANACRPLRLLHVNDYILEKAFVCTASWRCRSGWEKGFILAEYLDSGRHRSLQV